MILVDSSGWIEFLTDGPLAREYARRLGDGSGIVTPSIVLYEVYKQAKRHRTDEDAAIAAAAIQKTEVIPLDDDLALEAADLSLEHRLAMADAIVLATARRYDAVVYTSDADFEGIEGAVVLKTSQTPKPGS